jgi:hypothetical protein
MNFGMLGGRMAALTDRSERHTSGLLERLSAIASFLYAFFLFMPLRGPGLSYDPLNAGWELALSYCLVHGKQFGTDVVFNFGPLGCCYPRLYYPDTYLLTLTFWFLLTIGCVFSLLRIADDLFQSKPLKYAWVIALISLIGLFSDVTCFAISLLICYRYFLFRPEERRVSLDLYLLSILAGILALSKFTFFLAALWSFAFISLDQLLKRKSPNYFFSFLLTFVGGWLLSHQSLSNLLPFFRNSFSIARGYSEAMAVSQVSEYLGALPTTFIVAGIIYLIFRLIAKRETIHVLLGSASFAGLCVLIFKAGFTRNETSTEHVVIPALCFAFLSILLLPNIFKIARKGFASTLAIVVAVAATCIILPRSYGTWIGIGPALIFGSALARSANNFSETVASIQGQNPQNKEYLAYMAKLKNDHPIPPLSGSADIYPWDFASGLANNLELDPRPVFQGYQAYSFDLLELDAEHLRNDFGPKWIVFNVCSALDNRLPALDDSMSWLELLRHYDIEKQLPQDVVLKRRAVIRNLGLNTIGSMNAKLGEQIHLPDFGNKIVWSTIELKRTPIGALQALIYKTLPPNIKLQLADGTTKSYTAPRQMLSTGFVLSPGIFDTKDFVHLYETEQDPKRKVTTISIEDGGHLPWDIFSKDFEIKFWEVKLGQ